MIDLTKTIDLSTKYLGLKLKNPLVASSSPMCRKSATSPMEDAGAAAVVLHSLFEEQIEIESEELDRAYAESSDIYAEATSLLPRDDGRAIVGPEGYLEAHPEVQGGGRDSDHRQPERHQHRRLDSKYAEEMEQAGADALELNIYYIPADPDVTGAAGGAEVRRPGARGQGQA